MSVYEGGIVMKHIYDMIVIGGGPGGYTAALYATRAGLDTLVLEKLSAGGQMTQTVQIDNYPGFDEGIDGFSLGEKMQAGAERFSHPLPYLLSWWRRYLRHRLCPAERGWYGQDRHWFR